MVVTNTNTLATGDVINNKWVVLGLIGKGGMGEVYRAHQSNLNRDVAIKVVSREWLESLGEGDEDAETLVQRLRREVQAMAQIRHPNIVQVFDHDSISVKICGQDAPIEYIAMEYIPGGSLRDTMSEDGFYPEEDLIKTWIGQYLFPVLTGVMTLHDSGIVHRDLKPENILMDHGTPKIADFGLARSCLLKPVTHSLDVKGSPNYMSPEQYMDLKRADQRADIYSLGKMLFEAVEGKIKSETIPFQQVKLTDAESPFFQELNHIIQMATAESREERTESVRDLLGQLERIIHGQEFQEKEKNGIDPVFHPLLKHTKWIWAGIFFAVFSVASMAIWHLMGEPGLRPQAVDISPMTSQQEITSRSSSEIDAKPAIVRDESYAVEHTGKQHLIQGGVFTVPDVRDGKNQQTVQVAPFYMDEFFVTNNQFVNFLNHNLSQISRESGVVSSKGKNWFLLGEIRAGYEPIVYRNGEFHITDPSYASSPVLRVTGYGAAAFADYFGRRLPTGMEMLYAMLKGAGAPKLNEEMLRDSLVQPQDDMKYMLDWNNETKLWPMESRPEVSEQSDSGDVDRNRPSPSEYLLSATSYTPNRLGVKGLNHEIGEWVYTGQVKSSLKSPENNRYAVVGGMEGAPGDNSPLPSVVERFPWEGFEEIGFRTVKSVNLSKMKEPVKKK